MRIHLTILANLIVFSALSQSYEEKAVAAVICAEAANQGSNGMVAVGEVIHRRCQEKGKTPLQTVLKHKAFSCLNRVSIDRLIQKFQRQAVFQQALKVANLVCKQPEKLPNLSHSANHFTRADERPSWSRGRKPVVVIGDHAFYWLAQY